MRKLVKTAAALLAGVLALGSLAGCGRKNITLADYPNTPVATLGDTVIYLDEANYQARSAQYTTEYYYSMFGYDIKDIWESDGSTTSMVTTTKTNAMQGIYQTYVLKAKALELGFSLTDEEKAKAAEVAQSWADELPETLASVVNVDVAAYTAWIENNALAMKAYQYAVKDVDREVSDEEAAQRKISYYRIQKAEDAEDADEAAEKMAKELLEEVKAGKTPEVDRAGELENVFSSTITYGAGERTDVMAVAGESLKAGESEMVYDEEHGYWYVVYCETEMDEEATASKKETIISDREAELFKTVYAEWQAAAPELKVDEKVWARVDFAKTLYVAETAAETEAAETEAEETEAKQ